MTLRSRCLCWEKKDRDVRPKNDRSYDYRGDCRHQHGARRDIFGVTNQGMELLDGGVGEQLQGSIQRFGCPYGAGGDHKTTPFDRTEVKVKSCAGNHDRGCRVDPGVMLGTKNISDPVKSVPNTLDSGSKFKRASH